MMERHGPELLEPQDQPVLPLLRVIQENASETELTQIFYQLRALLPEDPERSRTIVGWYMLLRQSPEYYSIAASVIYFIVDCVCATGNLQDLKDYVTKNTSYKSDVNIPRLTLRQMLSRIMNRMNESEAQKLIGLVSRLHLGTPPDSYKQLHKLFEMMEKKGLLIPSNQNLPELCACFQQLGRNDIIKEFLVLYDPHHRISLPVLSGINSKLHSC